MHSRSVLNITENSLSVLLAEIDAFPKLLNILSTFAVNEVPCHEGQSGLHALTTYRTDQGDLDVNHLTNHHNMVFELCFMLKYVELNGNKSDPVPWSVRQMLVYQKMNDAFRCEIVILVRASENLRRLMNQMVSHYSKGIEFWAHWTRFPTLAVSSLSTQWAEYIEFLELGVWKIVRCQIWDFALGEFC